MCKYSKLSAIAVVICLANLLIMTSCRRQTIGVAVMSVTTDTALSQTVIGPKQIKRTTTETTIAVTTTAVTSSETKTASTTTKTSTTMTNTSTQTTTKTSITTTKQPLASVTTMQEVQEEYISVPEYAIPQRQADYLFVGDSRTVGMAVYNPMTYIAEVGCGINFVYDNYDEITSYRDSNIVFNLGVNDLGNIQNYINLYWNFPEEFVQNNHIIIVSVNPTDGSYDYLNSSIDDFNAILADNLPENFEYIDTNSYLKAVGFGTVDGLHYDGYTYQLIYNAVIYGF